MEITNVIKILPHLMHKYMNEKMKDQNFSNMSVPYLMMVYKNDGICMKELTSHICFDKANTTRAIRDLEKKELINRVTDTSDRRKNKIFITEKGKETIKKIKIYHKEWQDKIIRNIKEEEIEKLNEILMKIYNNATENGKGE